MPEGFSASGIKKGVRTNPGTATIEDNERSDHMGLTFYHYPKCGTCRKAKKWLDDNEVSYEEINLVENPPEKEQLREMYRESGLPIRRFFNTSGKKYRELGLKDKIGESSEEELLELLASDGMLIKRPLATDGENITLGFKEETYEEAWK
jgi:arsenate reductase (glutaredoxin)